MMDRSRSFGLLKGLEFNYEVMEEELTCPVCLELYADPLILTCSHSICKKCLQDIFDSKINKDGDYCHLEYELECPSCRQEFILTREQLNKLPKNLALENVVIRYTEERSKSIRKSLSLESPISDLLFSPILDLAQIAEFPSESSTSCEMCNIKSQSMASWYCNQCAVAYCNSCLTKYHPNRGPLARHKVVPYDEPSHHTQTRYCTDHEKEQVAMFCGDCSVFVCHLCVCQGQGQHISHKMMSSDTACTLIKTTVEEIKSNCDGHLSKLVEQKSKLQNYLDEIKNLHNQSIARVEQHYRRLVIDLTASLDAEKSRIMNDLTSTHYNEVTKVKGYLPLVEKYGEDLLRVSQQCTNILEMKYSSELLLEASNIEKMKSQLEDGMKGATDLGLSAEAAVQNKVTRCRLQAGIISFREGSSQILQMFQDLGTYSTIVPVVKMPTLPGCSELSVRSPVQNKCLTTWGFSSTSFTGTELQTNSSWTVTVERSTGSGINFNTGNLFGVGISSESLNIKDLVGSTEGTYGIVCNNGSLCFATNGNQESLTQLDCLPLSLTVSINTDHQHYTVLSYKLEAASPKDNSHNLPLEGRKLLDDPRLKEIIYPVFTVSQRVKLLFPTYV